VNPFEEAMLSELGALVRAGVPVRGVHITVRELLSARMERGPLGPREVGDAVEATVRAACRLVRERDASGELVETVCRATIEVVRGHGGETARWLTVAMSVTHSVLDELARERAEEPTWRWIAGRLPYA